MKLNLIKSKSLEKKFLKSLLQTYQTIIIYSEINIFIQITNNVGVEFNQIIIYDFSFFSLNSFITLTDTYVW